MINQNFVYVAVALSFFGTWKYLRETWAGRTAPHRVTWGLWAIEGILAFGVELQQHVGLVAIMTLMLGLGPLFILVASFHNQQASWAIDRIDIACGVVSLLGLIIWLSVNEATFALITFVVADAIAALPTFRKSWSAPSSETWQAFGFGATNCGIALLALRHFTTAGALFPGVIFVSDTLLTILIIGRIGPRLRGEYTTTRWFPSGRPCEAGDPGITVDRVHLPAFHYHLLEAVVIIAAGIVHRTLIHDRRCHRYAAIGLGSLFVVTMWPIGDVAADVSLTVATVQRLVIILLVSPLLLWSLPVTALSRLTRPALVDAVTRRLAHPGVALAVVTIVGTLTLSAPVVDWGATSHLGRDLILVTVLAVGCILWTPALAIMPGAKRLSPAGRAGYIIGSSIVVTSLSFVWIFSLHSLYPALHGQEAVLHVTPVFDQQLAGFVAKLGAYIPMWIIAFNIFFNADDAGISVDESPLHWADVERRLERLDRQRARALRRHRPT